MCRVTITTFSNPWCQPLIPSSLDPTAGHEILTLYVSTLAASLHPHILLPLWDPSLWIVSKAFSALSDSATREAVWLGSRNNGHVTLSNLYWVITAHRKQICTWTDSPRSFLEPAVVKGYKLSVPRWIRSGDLMVTIVNNTVLLYLKLVESRS